MLKIATIEDLDVLTDLAIRLWENHEFDELKKELETLVTNKEAVCFLKYIEDKPIGFAQCRLRHDYVEGTETSPVGYIEGVYVLYEYRRRHVAKELVEACEKWTKEQNCTQIASDCELNNEMSYQFHLKMGYTEANRIICFTKNIK